jgi:RHS repeat-associated protein
MMRAFTTATPAGTVGTFSTAAPFRFSAKYTDVESGLIYYGYRYYQPSTGRWWSRDPIGETGGDNLYGACFNMQVNTYDLLGLSCESLRTHALALKDRWARLLERYTWATSGGLRGAQELVQTGQGVEQAAEQRYRRAAGVFAMVTPHLNAPIPPDQRTTLARLEAQMNVAYQEWNAARRGLAAAGDLLRRAEDAASEVNVLIAHREYQVALEEWWDCDDAESRGRCWLRCMHIPEGPAMSIALKLGGAAILKRVGLQGAAHLLHPAGWALMAAEALACDCACRTP